MPPRFIDPRALAGDAATTPSYDPYGHADKDLSFEGSVVVGVFLVFVAAISGVFAVVLKIVGKEKRNNDKNSIQTIEALRFDASARDEIAQISRSIPIEKTYAPGTTSRISTKTIQYKKRELSLDEFRALSLDEKDVYLLQDVSMALRNRFDPIIESYLPILVRKKNQLIFTDDYGDEDHSDFDREISRFVGSKLASSYDGILEKDDYDWFNLESLVRVRIRQYERNNPGERNALSDLDEIVDPFEYESAVTAALNTYGWIARTTKKSGDQGADIIAESDGLKLVVQCKLYSQPVGNKAVQEVYAASKHESADFAAVVTNSEFTRAARQLAKSTNVFLIHHSALEEFSDSLLSEPLDDSPD